MHPYQYAQEYPDRIAFAVVDTGEQLTYRQLDEESNRLAHLFRRHGLKPGDRVALLLNNCPEFPLAYWGAQRAGLMAVLLSTHLKADEAAYIINDSDAKILICTADVGPTPGALAERRNELIPGVRSIFGVGPSCPDVASLDEALAPMPSTPIADQISGYYVIYSSGTTGRPKGIILPFQPGPIEAPAPNEPSPENSAEGLVGFSPGPLYHGAPLAEMKSAHRLGGTALTMRKFDAAKALQAIEDWGVAHANFVPTMFVRMLALPLEVRARFDLSSLRSVVHAGAPCPVEIKMRMMEWFGPIIHEYYSSSECIGSTHISPQEWLRKPGSVGRPRSGFMHICDEDGLELPIGAEGIVYFEDQEVEKFSYLNDPEKTRLAAHPLHKGWQTVRDIGRLDEDGYLFLTDRKDFMIISGGVNIYPRAVEDTIIVHPKVLDAAVIGIPNLEYGEEVKAIVQPKDWNDAGDALAAEIIAWCHARISRVTCPRSIEFVEELPRLSSGKLAKHELRKRFAVQKSASDRDHAAASLSPAAGAKP
jgi:fatty-acyl-CoA synthase